MQPTAFPERALSEVAPARVVAASSEARRFLQAATWFVLVGLVLYGGLYAFSEWLVYRHAQTNKFFVLQTAPRTRYDFLILGASHAATLGYQDMTAQLEAMTGRSIINLAVVGGGVRVNRLMYDCFLAHRQTGAIVYVVDSFAFYSRQWNEDRLQDRRLFLRTPFDSTLAGLLLRNAETRLTGLDFVVGFSKINNQGRFAADITPEERTRFTRTYRPVRQLDEQRLAYLYPKPPDGTLLEGYLAEFDALLGDAVSRGIRVIVVKPPLPERVAALIPDEERFDSRLKATLGRLGVSMHDFTHADNADTQFYDTDHLNRTGVLTFFEHSLVPVLK